MNIYFIQDNMFKQYDTIEENLGVGRIHQINEWLSSMGIESYKIKEDLTIDVYANVDISKHRMKELPTFIKFDRIYGGFYAAGNDWQTLRGFPNTVDGDLQIKSPSVFVENDNTAQFLREEVKTYIDVKGIIYNK